MHRNMYDEKNTTQSNERKTLSKLVHSYYIVIIFFHPFVVNTKSPWTNLHHPTLIRSVKVGVVEQKVGGQFFVLVTQHVGPEDGLSVESERFEL